MLESITKDVSISLRKLVKNCGAFIWCSVYMLHQIKVPQFDTDLGLQNTVESSCKW